MQYALSQNRYNKVSVLALLLSAFLLQCIFFRFLLYAYVGDKIESPFRSYIEYSLHTRLNDSIHLAHYCLNATDAAHIYSIDRDKRKRRKECEFEQFYYYQVGCIQRE